jgi:hypothetical protein
MVGYRDRRHFQGCGAVHKLADFASAIEKTVVGMKMQMNEIIGCHSVRIVAENGFPRRTSVGSFRSSVINRQLSARMA